MYKNKEQKNNYELYEEEVNQLYLEGASIQELSFIFNIDYDILRNYLKLVKRQHDPIYEKILLLKRRGLSIDEISIILDIDKDKVIRYHSTIDDNKTKGITRNINYFRDALICVRFIRDSMLYPRAYDLHTVIRSLVSKGLTGTEIGDILGISKQTVSNYMKDDMNDDQNS